MKPTGEPIRVLCVIGAGHSGSTLLDILLSSHPEIEGVGELSNLPRGGWVVNELCSCGERAKDCPFWSDVRRAWVERIGVDDVEGYYALQRSFARVRSWPRVLQEWRRPSPRFQVYAERTRALFEAIREVSGKPIIVDSSKGSVRAFALARISGIDLRLVHLIRDGRGVATSFKKDWRKDLEAGVTRDVKSRPVWRTAPRWILANLQAEWVCSVLGPDRSVRVRYEDLVTDPGEVLARIGRLVDVDLTEVAYAVSVGDAVEVGHNIAGNHLRMSERVRIRPDAGQWKNKLSVREQQQSGVLMGWLLRRYGYEL